MNTQIERRQHPRIPLNWPVVILAPKGTIFGETSNISVSGTLLLCPYTFETDDKFQILITPPGYGAMPVTCEKVWLGNFYSSAFIYVTLGVRFIKISSIDQDIIASFVDEYIFV